ncbi:hypothetical protein [Algoriphagus litoralis]|uniref:hypothetical protein n=1 Tax=Algoriphagus litoralis TaxID=2202829 RepID=UPI000DB974B9|nr:hypothetical protein [Algoriphagus litoralis]
MFSIYDGKDRTAERTCKRGNGFLKELKSIFQEMRIVYSFDKIPIRIPTERWEHVILGHPEMIDFEIEVFETLSNPDVVFEGNNLEKIAVKDYLINLGKIIVVVYKELNKEDGFLVTSFLTSKMSRLEKKKMIWKK